MAVYDCQCGLVLSTTREHPVCPRCHRVVEADRPAGQTQAVEGDTVIAPVETEQRAAGVEAIVGDSIPAPLGVHAPMFRVAALRQQPPGVDLCLG
jgi:hypothetical protein